MMMFDEYTKNMIILGRKTVTRRLVRNNVRPAVPNSIHKIKIDRTRKRFGSIYIKKCYKQNLKDMNRFDGIKEGFPSTSEYLKYFKKINNITDTNVEVWVIEFKLIKGRI